MSAIRMIAYGVIEVTDEPTDYSPQALGNLSSEQIQKRLDGADALRLAKQEFLDEGLSIVRSTSRTTKKKKTGVAVQTTTRLGGYTVYGREQRTGFGPTRDMLCQQVTFRVACVVALRWLEPDNKELLHHLPRTLDELLDAKLSDMLDKY